jgi:hypothetical protein
MPAAEMVERAVERARAELAARLGPRWPAVAPATLAQAQAGTFHSALVNGVAALAIERFTPSTRDPAGTEDDILAQGERLLSLVAPDATDQRIGFTGAPSA